MAEGRTQVGFGRIGGGLDEAKGSLRVITDYALAAGVDNTSLMRVFIAYLCLVHGISNFFVPAPKPNGPSITT